MKGTYFTLLGLNQNNKTQTPTIVCVKNLPENDCYIKHANEILYTRHEKISDIVQQKDNYNYKIGVSDFGKDAYEIYGAAIYLADKLNLKKCPQIIGCSAQVIPDYKGMTIQDELNQTYCILIKNSMPLWEKLETLAHEMRHAWQHQVDHNKFFANYNFNFTKDNLEEYYLQPAEVDAEAFSFLAMQDFAGEKAPYNRKSFASVNERINARIKNITY